MSINVGILGFAHGHVGVYCDQWVKMAGAPVRIVLGWDHDAQRASAAREKLECDIAASPEAMLQRDGLDAVVIGAETSMHADLVEAAAGAGKKIILQKPLALNLEQGERMITAVEKARVPFSLAWQMR